MSAPIACARTRSTVSRSVDPFASRRSTTVRINLSSSSTLNSSGSSHEQLDDCRHGPPPQPIRQEQLRQRGSRICTSRLAPACPVVGGPTYVTQNNVIAKDPLGRKSGPPRGCLRSCNRPADCGWNRKPISSPNAIIPANRLDPQLPWRFRVCYPNRPTAISSTTTRFPTTRPSPTPRIRPSRSINRLARPSRYPDISRSCSATRPIPTAST